VNIYLEAVQYKCPNCSGELKFKPDKQAFGCDFCLSLFSEEEIKSVCAKAENSIPAKEQLDVQNEFAEHTNLYHCGSCGAEIICEDNQTATFCCYCHEPVILSGRMSGEYTPGKIIGFKLTREEALKKFDHWCKKRMFLPKSFKNAQQLEKMTGLYVPFWIADCDMKASFNGTGKRVRTWTSGSYRYTETKEYEVLRRAEIFADGIPADGESKIEDLLMESIEPYNYTEAKDFSMSYLSGFVADKYDIDKAGVFPNIKKRAESAAKEIVKRSLSEYTSVIPMSQDYRIVNTDWQYMLLPVWFMNYKYNGETYSFALNGQTGKLAGTPPLDKKMLKLFSIGIGAITSIIVAIIAGGLM